MNPRIDVRPQRGFQTSLFGFGILPLSPVTCSFGLLACIAAAALAAETSFATKPTALKEADKVKISFAVTARADVEVAVLAADGKVARHLAAGVLASSYRPPEPLREGLSQELVWDGKDDLGKPAAGGSFKVRVRAGMGVKLGGFIGNPEVLEEKCFGLATDDKGQLYVATGGGYGGNLFTIKVFDREGKYLWTINPYPACRKVEDIAGFAKHTPLDGKLNPPQFNALLPWLYPDALGALMGNRVQADTLWLTSGSGQICRIRSSDGACLSWNAGKAPARAAQGPICWAVAPDGKALFLAGWYQKGKEPDGQVFRVDPATGERSGFVKIAVPADSFWQTEKNGWYDFTNWGRKNGVCAIHGLAVDQDGRVYVCDRVQGRLAVYDSVGKLLGSTALGHPDHVSLRPPPGQEVYLTTRRIVDGYQAVNEVKVVKLSGWKDGKVLAELKLAGRNAPNMAVDATQDPPVIWLSNVGDKGGITRIEDRGAELVVTGRLNEKSRPMPGAVVKVWADPLSDNVIVSDGWAGQFCFNGLTCESQKWPLKGMELAFDRDGNYYVYGQNGWHELVTRFGRDFKPLPFPATGKNTTTMTITNKDVYGRYGHGWCNKGLCVAPDGRIYVYNMYDWSKYFVNVWSASGQAEKHDRVGDGIVGPLHGQGGGVCVDLRGNLYVGLYGRPKHLPAARANGDSTIVKFGPAGGAFGSKGDKPGIEWTGLSGGDFVEGASAAYPGLAPQGGQGCVCKEARFDLDDWGRLYIPNALEYCVRVVDNAGNEILKFGYYGNPDSRGEGSAVPDPQIAFGWPLMASAGQIHKGRIYVADTLNHRVARMEVSYRAEETCEIK